MAFVVPGANASSSLSLMVGNNSLLVTTLTPLPLVVASLDFNLTHSSAIKADACCTLLTSSNNLFDVRYHLLIDDRRINSDDLIQSIFGNGSYMNINITQISTYVGPGCHTLKLVALTNAPLGTISCVNASINCLGNIL